MTAQLIHLVRNFADSLAYPQCDIKNYYDLDMTVNDRGIYGGPYSIDNYQSTAVGKARVYDLEMPFEIWNGQTPQVKAKAVHTK